MIFLRPIIVKAQSEKYELEKLQKEVGRPSPFEEIITGQKQDQIIYQDENVLAFVPLRKQAPVHFLIVPRKKIYSLNNASTEDELVLGRLLSEAKDLVKKYEVDKTGYRVSINTNENAGQTVFHLHVHRLGGMHLGPMVEQSYKEN